MYKVSKVFKPSLSCLFIVMVRSYHSNHIALCQLS